MAEGGGGGVGGGTASSSSSTLLSGGGRLRFEVELIPGETTIVSWKKLMKDANKASKNKNDNEVPAVSAPSVPVPVAVAVAANPALDSRIAPPSGNVAGNEANEAPPGSRFSAVIEKIERLYMGKNSSDEEDLNDVPDDDEYDTEDSFIDDAELDDYFQVDNSAIKHDGFFVNRGKLERINEPIALPSEQPKKRRRKDSTKGDDGSKLGHMPNKQMKANKNEKKKMMTSTDKSSNASSHSINALVHNEDVKYQNTVIALGTVLKKSSDKNVTNSSPTNVLNSEAIMSVKKIDKQKSGVLQPKKHGSKTKDGSQTSVLQRINEKGADVLKSQGQSVHNAEETNQSVLPREKNTHQQADAKASEIAQQPKAANMVRKEGSSTKPKSTNTMLEKAIRDLEKTVAEIRPPSMEVQEAENSSQVKRRMPPEIKQKLAKVARLAHAIHGKLSKELLNRLMSILGHLIQIRSLKRNLQNMVVMGLSAKEQKDGQLQQLKKEVDEMVKIRAPTMKLEAIEQQAGSSDDFQQPSTKDKVNKSLFITDDALEDKICDLYDLFVDGLEEDAGPQVRKLYAELAELWPKGCMDNHGIKRAICRAKDRRKALYRRKDQENMKRKKLVSPKTDTITVDNASIGQVQQTSDKLESGAPVRSLSSTMAAARPFSLTTDKPKHEKLKGNVNNQGTTTAPEVTKKIAKRKPETESYDGQIRPPEKSNLAQGKQVVGGIVKLATQTTADGGQPKVNNIIDMV
ncbi:hypothetical protein R6Q59_010668 [Mikania micrantha]|uniref:Hpc2-related domain-containing protein n=1 Tax=Mikania micrantha TaxID=192012 RepID=A0A5N6N4Q8_9ASTR|nr:hypothetical protein E3N88_25352 [Mikania micrantha]